MATGREVSSWGKGVVSARWLREHLGASWLRVIDVRDASAVLNGARPERKSGPVLRSGDEHNPPRFVELGPGNGWLRAGEWPPLRSPNEAFQKGHIPGAIAFDVGRQCFDAEGSLVWLPELAMVMSGLGVGDEHAIVLVDDIQPAAALVAAWILRRAGHPSVGILEGGYPRWVGEGAPTTREVVRHPFASFTAKVR